MHTHEPAQESNDAAPGARSRGLAPGIDSILFLQRHAGNRAVAGLAAAGRLTRPRRARLQRQMDAGVPSGGLGEDLDAGTRDDPLDAGEPLPGGVPEPAPASSSPPSPPPPPAPGSSCQVDVRATHIGGSLSWAPIWHLYIVHTDAAGNQTGWRGGPGGPGPGSYGSIIGTTGPYDPSFIDWDPGSPSVTVGSGSAVCGKTTCFASELARIDATRTTYAPTGPNSNTWVKTVLDRCGLPKRKPVWIAPGFGDPNL